MIRRSDFERKAGAVRSLRHRRTSRREAASATRSQCRRTEHHYERHRRQSKRDGGLRLATLFLDGAA